MTQALHDLGDEFPDKADMIHLLKVSDPRFCQLAGVYEDINSEIVRIEESLEPRSDVYLEDLKKRRLRLLDRITELL